MGGSSASALALAAAAGIHTIQVPAPFGMGPTNAYLITGEPLALVDPGPNWATSLEGLERELARCGHALGDIGLIILTHQHVDHEGLAGYVARRNGAEVACLDVLAPYLSSFEESIETDYSVRDETMRRHGVDRAVLQTAHSASWLVQRYGGVVTPTRLIADGDVLEFGDRRLRFLFRPGHSPSDTVIVDEDHDIALAGDHLLPTITSNALVDRSLKPGANLSRTRALITYRGSLSATRELDIEVAFPGHGDPIIDHRKLIDERFEAHDRRAERLLDLLKADGVNSAYGLACAMWGDRCLAQPFLTVSEVLGHLDLLVEQGLIAEHDADGVTAFSCN